MDIEQQEAFLAGKLKEFTDKMNEAAKGVIGDIYCDYLPHVMSDTECNVSIQATEAVGNILEGRFTVEGDYLITNNGNVRVWLANPFISLCTKIYTAVQDKIENLTIKELQCKVKSLEDQLVQAYRRY